VAKTDVKGLAKTTRPLAGRRGKGCLLGDPQGVEVIGVGCYTSVTASRMTDAYGASTLTGAIVMVLHSCFYPNADYLEERIYTKCRLSGGANLHQMQIIGEGESTPNADYRGDCPAGDPGRGPFCLARGRGTKCR